MPVDARNAELGWKRGVPSTGLGLVTSSASGVDEYGSQDVPELTELYRLTGDHHDFAPARLLLHDTLSMPALPSHLRPRGTGLAAGALDPRPAPRDRLHLDHVRDWVPWIAAVPLRAILLTGARTPGPTADSRH